MSEDQSKEDLASECSSLEGWSMFLGGIGDLVSAIPVVGSFCAGATQVANLAVDYAHIEKGCDDIPFDEIKEIMDKRFSQLDRAIDRNYAAIQQLRTEMHRRFDEVLQSINDLRIKPVLSELKNFIDYFDIRKDKYSSYSRQEYISELDIIQDFIDYLHEAVKPNTGTLHSNVHHIINQNFAIIEYVTDNAGFLALDSLYNGVQCYVNVLFFLFKQHSFLADYYYGENDLDNYNKQLSLVRSVFDDFETLFDKNALIDSAVVVLKDAQDKEFVSDEFKDVIESLPRWIKTLKNVKDELKNAKLPMILDLPKKLLQSSTLQFKPSSIHTPICEWKQGARVKYAMQYRRNGLYSKVGPWSTEYIVGDKAFGTLDLPKISGTARLIFRKFDTENNPQLVGVIEDDEQSELWDINRDLYNAASMQNKNDAKKLVGKLINNHADVNASFDQGRKALHAAAEKNNRQMAVTLFNKAEADVNIKDDNGYTPLHVAAELEHNDIIQLLLERNADVKAKTFVEELTPLHLAVRNKHITTIQLLVQANGVDINLPDKSGSTPLHYAIREKLPISVVNAILASKDVDVNAVNKNESTPLHYAVDSGSDYVQALLKTGKVFVNKKTNNGLTALHLAVIQNSVEIAEMLSKDEHLNIDSPAVGDLTPFHIAAMVSDVKMVQFFQNYHANVNAKDAIKWTPLHYAVTLSKEDVVLELLKNEKINPNIKTENGYTPLHIAVGTGQKNLVLTLLNNHADIESKTNEGFTPLHIASMHDNIEMFTILLERNADIHAESPLKKTVLTLAIEKGNLILVKYLLDKNYPNRFPVAKTEIQELIDLSTKNGRIDILKYFVDEYKFDGKQYGSFRSLLRLAIQSSHLNVVKYLIEEKIDFLNEADDNKFLVEAARYGNLPIVRYILNKNWFRLIYYTFRGEDEYNVWRVRTALIEAVTMGHTNVAEYLISQGAITTAENEDDQTPAQIAKKQNLTNLYKLLKIQPTCFSLGRRNLSPIDDIDYDYINEKCIDVEKSRKADIIYYTKPLHLAITYGRINDAKKFINNGADINSQAEPSANTPSHLAAQYKYWDLLKVLIREEADVRIKNRQNKKPIDIARENGAGGDIITALNNAEYYNNEYTRPKRSIETSKTTSDKKTTILNYLIGKGCFNAKTPVCLDGPSSNQDKVQLKKALCFHDNVSVGLLFLQTILDKKYPLPNLAQISPEEARLTALDITEEFEAIFREAVKNSNVHRDDFDFYQLNFDIEASIKKEKFSEVPKIIFDFIKKNCPSNESVTNKMLDNIKNMFRKTN